MEIRLNIFLSLIALFDDALALEMTEGKTTW